jgi:imidazole glycerol-phosphate synthase subunit HisF
LFPVDSAKLIAFGGLDEPAMIERVLRSESVSAVAIGNSLSYGEHRVQRVKRDVDSPSLRPANPF